MSSNYSKMNPLNDNSRLKDSFWNVNGLSEKNSQEDFFLKQSQVFGIIFLSGTWHRKTQQIKCSTHMDTFIKTYPEKRRNGKEECLEGF